MTVQKKWTQNDIPDQTGRLVIVTGGNSGIGLETVRALVNKRAKVILASRNPEKGYTAIDHIRKNTSDGNVTFMHLDLASLNSVKAFATEFKDQYNKLDLLINNAGIMMPPYGKTKDGFEQQFGTNHLGHFALTGLLMKQLLSTTESRIVTVSSSSHWIGKITFDDLNREKSYTPMGAYAQSKLANLLFTYELQRKLDRTNTLILAAAAHPGWTATNLQRYAFFFRLFNPLFAQKPEPGAWPILYAATADDVRGGDYYGPEGVFEARGHPKKVTSSQRSNDSGTAAKLWQVSEKLTGVKFNFDLS